MGVFYFVFWSPFLFLNHRAITVFHYILVPRRGWSSPPMQAGRSCNVTYPAAHLARRNGPGTKPAWPSSPSGPERSLEPSQEPRKIGAQRGKSWEGVGMPKAQRRIRESESEGNGKA